MKHLLLFMLFFPSLSFGQKCRKVEINPKTSESKLVPCQCPAHQDDGICYRGDWTQEFYNQHKFANDLLGSPNVFCIGNKYFAWDNDAWTIDTVMVNTIDKDTVYKYSLSRRVGKWWHIPKNRVKGFDAYKWSNFQSQIEMVGNNNGTDTMVNDIHTIYHSWYVVKRDDSVSIDTLYVGNNNHFRNSFRVSHNFSKYSEERKQKCFFLTGYKYDEWIEDKGKSSPAMDYVADWEAGTLIK